MQRRPVLQNRTLREALWKCTTKKKVDLNWMKRGRVAIIWKSPPNSAFDESLQANSFAESVLKRMQTQQTAAWAKHMEKRFILATSKYASVYFQNLATLSGTGAAVCFPETMRANCICKSVTHAIFATCSKGGNKVLGFYSWKSNILKIFYWKCFL